MKFVKAGNAPRQTHFRELRPQEQPTITKLGINNTQSFREMLLANEFPSHLLI